MPVCERQLSGQGRLHLLCPHRRPEQYCHLGAGKTAQWHNRRLFWHLLSLRESWQLHNFLINSNSLWSFAKFVNNQGTALVSEKADPAIKPGLNIVNTLLVRMQGGHIDFFVDGAKIGAADDATFSAGLIGL